jgi:hypothetical protein
MRAILAAVAIGSLASCDLDNCTNGDARCVGNVAENCVAHDGGSLWGQDSCDESCVIADGRAICALASTLDPACPSTDATTACVGNTAVSWTACYLTSEQSCAGACIDPTTSTECSAYDAFCAESPDPDPLCANAYAACADSTTLVQCFCGYRTDTEPCPSTAPSCKMIDNEGECQP